MKELDSFTVERLEEIIRSRDFYCHEDTVALARIALAAKRAEPVGYLEQNHLDYLRSGSDADIWPEGGAGDIPVYLTPQLNSPEIPDGWIKCSDQMPENDEFVRIWPLPDFGVELHVGQYIKFHKNGPGWFAQVYEYNYGVDFYPITVTHWMPLQPAPEKP
ncbi:DUF551 domain-containing protein [Yersinia enterocolitica]